MRTTLGLPANVEGVLAYLFGPLGGIVLLLIERNHFVRFHAMQSTVTFISLWILAGISRFVPFVGWILTGLVNIVAVAFWIGGIYKAYCREYYKFPFFGDLAESLLRLF
ncbi:DUF4870 domain-containing protein [Archaeoglobus profundus]|uniref:DUF4870 domain-containing protein n=1 Tax=Archaeoglobus profundus (strain DSM 5631 / JCM 9629 / NBRC 100127 / Av18) TaxID=572546 RepID=D2RGJ0_ARCPA|nr:DUF4870 domain-containing protein [Archaeoglobus profundus]ADB57415.1 protein of unknown function UPF0132 [Archaeoglobus profundus DSM 5631]